MSTQQSSQHLLTSVANTISTPPSSFERSGVFFIKPTDNDEDGDGDVQMGFGDELTPGKMMNLIEEGDLEDETTQEMAGEHRRTDHDRQGNTEADMKESQSKAGSSQEAEQGNPSQEGSTTWSRESILERLQADVGPLYMLCRLPHPVMRPHPTQDLLSLYSLQPLAATVARTDPVTGEKRKIRKTYKGKIQSFGLAGRNQEVKHPEGKPGGLVEMMHWPDEEWQNQKVAGKEIEKGLGDTTLSKLERAMKLGRGPLPGFDANVLGLDIPAPISQDQKKQSNYPPTNNNTRQQPTTTNPTQTTKTSNPPRPSNTNTNPNTNPPPPTAATGEAARPKRTGKKRRYDEHSFEGYGEGFVDDEIGYSTSDREERRNSGTNTNTSISTGTGTKKRKKNTTTDPYTTGPNPPPLERGSYGVGMVGIGSGVGAYGAR